MDYGAQIVTMIDQRIEQKLASTLVPSVEVLVAKTDSGDANPKFMYNNMQVPFDMIKMPNFISTWFAGDSFYALLNSNGTLFNVLSCIGQGDAPPVPTDVPQLATPAQVAARSNAYVYTNPAEVETIWQDDYSKAKATASEVANKSNVNHWVSPSQVETMIVQDKATDSDVATRSDVNHWVNPAQVDTIWFDDYEDNKASAAEIAALADVNHWVSPKQVGDAISVKQDKHPSSLPEEIGIQKTDGDSYPSGKTFTDSLSPASTANQVPTAGATYEAILDAKLAQHEWLPAVETLADLPDPSTLDRDVNYLIKVVEAGQVWELLLTGDWHLYSNEGDYVTPTELDDALDTKIDKPSTNKGMTSDYTFDRGDSFKVLQVTTSGDIVERIMTMAISTAPGGITIVDTTTPASFNQTLTSMDVGTFFGGVVNLSSYPTSAFTWQPGLAAGETFKFWAVKTSSGSCDGYGSFTATNVKGKAYSFVLTLNSTAPVFTLISTRPSIESLSIGGVDLSATAATQSVTPNLVGTGTVANLGTTGAMPWSKLDGIIPKNKSRRNVVVNGSAASYWSNMSTAVGNTDSTVAQIWECGGLYFGYIMIALKATSSMTGIQYLGTLSMTGMGMMSMGFTRSLCGYSYTGTDYYPNGILRSFQMHPTNGQIRCWQSGATTGSMGVIIELISPANSMA